MKRVLWGVALMAALAAPAAYAATAFFTGKQEMVQSVTGRMVWKCQYQYAGRYFTALFETSCPSSIEVE